MILKGMSIRNRLKILSGISILVILIQSGALIFSNKTTINLATQINTTEVPILNKAHELKMSVVQVQQWLTDISATRALDGLNDGFDEAEKNAGKFSSILEELKKLDATNSANYNAMLPEFNDYYRVGKMMAKAYIDEGPNAGNRLMSQFDAAASKITTSVDRFLQTTVERTHKVLLDQQQATNMVRLSIAIGLTLMITSVLLIWFIVSQALINMPRIIEKLATGDLSTTFTTTKNDEIGQILGSMQLLRDRLLNMVSQIKAATVKLTSTSEDMTLVSSQTNNSVQQLHSEAEQSATAMNQMTITVQEVTGNIAQTASAAQEAFDETNAGQQVIEQAIDQIRQLANQIDNASSTIQSLEHESANITSVVDVIKGVAEQTNLLALNAAIEAARAGEQGRGFAVVADEVRTLASRTQQSTDEINRMFEKLLSGTRNAVDTMVQSREQAHIAVEQGAKANTSLNAIANAVGRINEMSTQIACAAEEQGAVAEEVNKNITRISDMANQSAQGAEKTAISSKELAQIALDLNQIVNQFKF